MTEWVFHVSELNEYVRKSLAGDPMLRMIALQGEISGFKHQVSSGHWYFTLKDEHARISCVLFRQYQQGISFFPKDGMQVILRGSVGLYSPGGSYQFSAFFMEEAGMGELQKKFEALKKRLTEEGLFDEARKRPLPRLPRMIGIVTSKTGAVIHDICTVAGRRNPSVPLLLCAASVQGEGAAEEIALGIKKLAKIPEVDVIIVGRGGGSMEDLWAFNEETVVRAIYHCPVPVVSAVGHEVDFTLSDFVADMRAATPSAAAELCVPTREELLADVRELAEELTDAVQNLLSLCRNRLMRAERILLKRHPLSQIREAKHQTTLAAVALSGRMRMVLTECKKNVSALSGKLEALSPKQVLNRGYAMALSDEGKPVSHIRDLESPFTLVLSDGSASVQVLSKKEDDEIGD